MCGQELEGKAFWTLLIARGCADHLQAVRCMHEGKSAPEHASRCHAHSKECMAGNHMMALTHAGVH